MLSYILNNKRHSEKDCSGVIPNCWNTLYISVFLITTCTTVLTNPSGFFLIAWLNRVKIYFSDKGAVGGEVIWKITEQTLLPHAISFSRDKHQVISLVHKLEEQHRSSKIPCWTFLWNDVEAIFWLSHGGKESLEFGFVKLLCNCLLSHRYYEVSWTGANYWYKLNFAKCTPQTLYK